MKSAIVSTTLLSREHPARRIRRVGLNAAWNTAGLLATSAVFLLASTYWPVLRALVGSLTVRGFRGAAHRGLKDATADFSSEAIYAAHTINGPTYAHVITTTDELIAELTERLTLTAAIYRA